MANDIIQQKPMTFSEVMTTELDRIENALPAGFNKTRFVHELVSLVNENKTLGDFAKQYGTAQIKLVAMNAAYLGLSFANTEVYAVPYGGKLNMMTSHKGAVKLAKKYSSRPIREIYAKVVREGETFNVSVKDGKQVVNYEAIPFSDAKIVGAFAVCEYMDGGMICDVMSRKDIEVTRSKSKAGKYGPWVDFYEEMCKKTVLHRLCKMIDLDFETAYQRQILDAEVEIENNADVVDVFEGGDADADN